MSLGIKKIFSGKVMGTKHYSGINSMGNKISPLPIGKTNQVHSSKPDYNHYTINDDNTLDTANQPRINFISHPKPPMYESHPEPSMERRKKKKNGVSSKRWG